LMLAAARLRELAPRHDLARGGDRARCRRRELLRSKYRRGIHALRRRVDELDRREAEEILCAEDGEHLVADLLGGIDVGRFERTLSRFVAHVDEADETAAREKRRGQKTIGALAKEHLRETLIGSDSVDEESGTLHGETIDEIVVVADDAPFVVAEFVRGDELEGLRVQVVRR